MPTEQFELTKGMRQEDTTALMALALPVHVASGATLFSLGSEAERLYVVQRGRIALTLPMQVHGREEDVLVEERLPGEAFGWSALIPPHRFTLKAAAPLDTDVLAFPRDALLEYFAERPELGYLVTRNVASVIGQRLQVFQAMWLREMQRAVSLRFA
jgi:CRP/FNR family cyclic AMP-dependent transcriptional regulator